MWIRMIHTAAGPRLPHTFEAGRVYEVADELGKEFISVKSAEEFHAPPKGAVETAAADQGEKALAPGAEKKSLIEQLRGGKLTAEAKASAKARLKELKDAEAADGETGEADSATA
jgi:hypothetical protein